MRAAALQDGAQGRRCLNWTHRFDDVIAAAVAVHGQVSARGTHMRLRGGDSLRANCGDIHAVIVFSRYFDGCGMLQGEIDFLYARIATSRRVAQSPPIHLQAQRH